MSRDNIIGLVIIMAIMIGYGIWTKPSEEELQEIRRADSLRQVEQESLIRQQQEQALQQEAQAQSDDLISEIVDPTDSVAMIQLKDRLGLFSQAAVGENENIVIETDLLNVTINTKGGFFQSVELKDYKTWEKEPLVLLNGDDTKFNMQFYSANRIISTQDLFFQPEFFYNTQSDYVKISGEEEFEVAMRLYADSHTQNSPKYIEFKYVFAGNDYMIDFDFNTVGMYDVIASNITYINLDWQTSLKRFEKNRENEQRASTIFYRFRDDDVESLSSTKDDSEKLTTSLHWVAFKQQFFSTTLIAKEGFSGAEITTEDYDESFENLLKKTTASIDIPYNSRENNSFGMSMYMGPNHFNTLKAYDLKLESKIDLGWLIMGWINRFVVIPVFNYLDSFNLSYGIVILLLTLLLKLALFPIAYKTYLSSARMRVLKPDIDQLGEKFPKKEDAMKKQQAVMALYKKAGVNPMAGCVPMLLQLPILIALFRFFPSSIELRQEAFLWADDLSSYDSILDLPFTIPFYGDHVSLFTLLMAASMVVYTHMNSQMMNTGTQMPGMKTMMYLMPVMMLGFFNSFASGLSYYYFLANVITFAQMYAFRFMIDEDKIRKKIEENKKKPVKKSGWQKRLEEMAKQQQQKQKKR